MVSVRKGVSNIRTSSIDGLPQYAKALMFYLRNSGLTGDDFAILYGFTNYGSLWKRLRGQTVPRMGEFDVLVECGANREFFHDPSANPLTVPVCEYMSRVRERHESKQGGAA